ncbi:MAG: ATP-binding cassette domain-containing protein [Gemmatimonadales bacterium]
MIALEQIAFERGGFRLEAAELIVPEGGYAAVIGPTGSGKTTLLELIAGHLAPARGTIRIGSRPMLGVPPEARGVGMVYQRHFLFPHLDVRANLGYGLRGRADRSARVTEVSELVEVRELLDRSVETLSGGERQRVALGRALAAAPSVLLLDEPLASLDPAGRRRLRTLLRRIHETEGTTVVHVTHDFEDALELAAQVAVMVSGRLVQQGKPVEVFRTPASPFVAEFIGSGNVLAGVVTADDDGMARFTTEALTLEVVDERRGRCHAMIRPEEIR